MYSKACVLLFVLAVMFATPVFAQNSEDSPEKLEKIGRGVTPPRPIYQPEPEYSDKARVAGYEGVAR